MNMEDQIQRIRDINEEKATQALDNARHRDSQLSAIATQEVIAKSFKTLVDYLDNKVTKTEVINQLQSISTPDIIHVVDSINQLHETLRTHENTDLSEITGVMRELLDEAKQIPKENPEIPEPKVIDYSKQFKGLETAIKAVEKVVKAQKLVAEAPIVNVPEPNVNIEAPDLEPLQKNIKEVVEAVKDIIIPEYKTDNKEVEKLLKTSNKLLKELLDKPVSRGGGGGGRVSPYENSSGIPQFVTLDSFGNVPVIEPSLAIQIDEVAPITYIGKAAPGTATTAASWQIKKIDSTSGTSIIYASGNSNFNKIWDDRAGLSYS
jgi:hypothetical protein